MDEPPSKSADETNEELIREWDLYYLARAKEIGALTASEHIIALHRLAKRDARRSKRLPPRSLTPTPEPRVAVAPQGKDSSWTAQHSSSPSPSEAPSDPPMAEPGLTPEQIAKAEGAVDRALAKPLRARS